MTTLAKRGGYLTIGDLLLLELPHLSERDREFVAWEFTGYPWWFDTSDGRHAEDVFRQQLRDWRNGEAPHA